MIRSEPWIVDNPVMRDLLDISSMMDRYLYIPLEYPSNMLTISTEDNESVKHFRKSKVENAMFIPGHFQHFYLVDFDQKAVVYETDNIVCAITSWAMLRDMCAVFGTGIDKHYNPYCKLVIPCLQIPFQDTPGKTIVLKHIQTY